MPGATYRTKERMEEERESSRRSPSWVTSLIQQSTNPKSTKPKMALKKRREALNLRILLESNAPETLQDGLTPAVMSSSRVPELEALGPQTGHTDGNET
jgi:hypothetical protein